MSLLQLREAHRVVVEDGIFCGCPFVSRWPTIFTMVSSSMSSLDEPPRPSPKPSSDDDKLCDAAPRCAAASGGLSLTGGAEAPSTQQGPIIAAEAAAKKLQGNCCTQLLPYCYRTQ